MARALLLLAAGLLAFPGIFVSVKGLAAIRRRSAVVQGKTVTGVAAVGAGLVLLLWGAGMLLFSVLVLAAQRGR
jgi:protein-S-isoprenylcysteine O-methyltransferase Ste14